MRGVSKREPGLHQGYEIQTTRLLNNAPVVGIIGYTYTVVTVPIQKKKTGIHSCTNLSQPANNTVRKNLQNPFTTRRKR
jgi:hypothetical protein